MQSIRGMRDQLPSEVRRWQRVERAVLDVLSAFGYDEIRLPLLEETALFSRSVGESTDIVEKEMYAFTDRDGTSIALRPEGTASCVRACLQHGLIFNQIQRLYYQGSMFRHERPQRGRYRQFHQIGAELFGAPGPEVDAELIQIGAAAWRSLGIAERVELEINTLGSPADRGRYREALVRFLEPHAHELDEDSRRRLTRNPLRILDSKDAGTQALLAGAPSMHDFLSDEARSHFDGVTRLLDAVHIPYRINARLVRGLDYYTHTVFEWVTNSIGAQGTICAGGRYDGLVAQLGGKPTPGAGFAMGTDRVVLVHEEVHGDLGGSDLDAYCVVLDEAHAAYALSLCQRLREAVPGARIRLNAGGGKVKRQMKRADSSGARWALIVGDDEVAAHEITVKWLRGAQPQRRMGFEGLVAMLAAAKTEDEGV